MRIKGLDNRRDHSCAPGEGRGGVARKNGLSTGKEWPDFGHSLPPQLKTQIGPMHDGHVGMQYCVAANNLERQFN